MPRLPSPHTITSTDRWPRTRRGPASFFAPKARSTPRSRRTAGALCSAAIWPRTPSLGVCGRCRRSYRGHDRLHRAAGDGKLSQPIDPETRGAKVVASPFWVQRSTCRHLGQNPTSGSVPRSDSGLIMRSRQMTAVGQEPSITAGSSAERDLKVRRPKAGTSLWLQQGEQTCVGELDNNRECCHILQQ